MGARRVRHRGGVSWLTRKENEAGEWSLLGEPENVLIDNFHRGEGPHVHDPDKYERRLPLEKLSPEEAYRRVVDHLERNGRINFEVLVKDLGGMA